MTPPTLVSPNSHTFVPWIAWLRIFAMLLVCIAHACDPLSMYGTADQKLWIEVWGSFVRPCVPLFVMMTGALLLPIHEGMGTFYKKRIGRILWPFLIWNVFYAAMPWVLTQFGVTAHDIQYTFFPYGNPLRTTALGFVQSAALSPLQFSQYAVHLWYVFLLIGLYLFMPILSAWIAQASQRAKLAFLGLWGITLVLHFFPLALEAAMKTSTGAFFLGDYVTRFLGENYSGLASQDFPGAYALLGQCDWNTMGTFTAFSGFAGYLVLGHLLKDVRLSLKKTLALALPLFLVGYAIVGFGSHWMWGRPDGTARMAELFFWYCSLPVAMMASAIFLLARHVTYAPPKVAAWLKDFGTCGFGIYCAHYLFVASFYYLMSKVPCPNGLRLPLVALLALAATWSVIHVLSKIPKSKYFIG
ncbi:MAG: acyltransferase [Kiritimatiellia bacterium]